MPFSEVAARVTEIRHRIAAAGGTDVQLVAVTKTFPLEALTAAVDAGCDAIGENYAQEAVAKLTGWRPTVPVQFIGHLQSNKVAMLSPIIDLWATIDRPSVIDAVARRVPAAQVFVQVNVSGEPQKGGCHPSETDAMVELARGRGLDVTGLMTLGAAGDEVVTRRGFALLSSLRQRLGLRHCSMGMSSDLEWAVAEGSTQVRVGSALFGERGGHR
jgi:PLP dependent protein